MREETRTLLFAAAVCVVCSLLLSGTAAALKKRQDANAAFDIRRNIVKAFGEDISEATPQSIDRIFREHIEGIVIDPETGEVLDGLRPEDLSPEDIESKRRLPVYIWKENGRPVKYAFPVSGKGLWSTIYGYLALDADLRTVVGVSFYKHGETPGLGGEIEKPWFQRQFAGKKVYDPQGRPLPFIIAKGSAQKLPEAEREYAVDGISGATLTGNGVQAFLRADLARYAKFFERLRQQQGKEK